MQHEGWVAPLFADGAEGVGTSGPRGVLVAHEPEEWRPDAAVVGWVARCECGWRGRPWTKVVDESAAEPSLRLLWHRREHADLDEAAEDLVIADWRQHIAPFKLLEAVEDTWEKSVAAGRALDEAVLAAINAGASFADIGRAAGGMARQSANERWSRLLRK